MDKSYSKPRDSEDGKVFYDPVGMIHATENTPDIVFPDDRSSEKVAVLSFLTLWFMPKPIQELVKKRASVIICALSPLSGGLRIEQNLSASKKTQNFTKLATCFDYSSKATKYEGACKYPKWNKAGRMMSQGYAAIYATSVDDDEAKGYTQRQLQKLHNTQFSDADVQQHDAEYRLLSDKSAGGLSVLSILEAYHSGEGKRDVALAQILSDEFSDIHSLYDMVPKRVGHEVAHLLEHGSGLFPHEFIQSEVDQHVPRRNSMLSHYAKASEAVAELAGIALLQHVRENAGLGFGIPTTMLDKILPDSYDYIEQQIDLLSRMGIRRNTTREPK